MDILPSQNTARIALGAWLAAEGLGALDRFSRRKKAFARAAARAVTLQRPLIVVGDPDTGMHTRLMRAYGCGDLCLDLTGCGACPHALAADITKKVPEVADNSAVVFVACTLEYVDNPFAAWAEVMRMAGSAENVFLVTVQPWTITGVLYPGANWAFYGVPPEAMGVEVAPVMFHVKAAYAALLGGLTYLALKGRP